METSTGLIAKHLESLGTADLFNHVANKINEFNELAGWNGSPDRFNAAEKIALIHSELSEALEGLRNGLSDDHLKHRPSVEVELADALVRIFHLAGYMKLDIGGAFCEKVAYNAVREDHKIENREKDGGKKF